MKLIAKGKNPLIFYQTLPTSSLRKYMDISVENFYLDILT